MCVLDPTYMLSLLCACEIHSDLKCVCLTLHTCEASCTCEIHDGLKCVCLTLHTCEASSELVRFIVTKNVFA